MRISDWSSDVCSSDLLSPSLLARRDQFAILERERPRAMKEFLTNIQVRFGGRDVYLFGFWPLLSDWAEEGLAQGVRGLFGPNSVLVTGGGTKGRQFADGWRRSEEHTSELQSLMRISYAVFCLKKKKHNRTSIDYLRQD